MPAISDPVGLALSRANAMLQRRIQLQTGLAFHQGKPATSWLLRTSWKSYPIIGIQSTF
jgi:hypothetical protein